MSLDTRARDTRDEIDALFAGHGPDPAAARRRNTHRRVARGALALVAVVAFVGGAFAVTDGNRKAHVVVTVPPRPPGPSRIVAIENNAIVELDQYGAQTRVLRAAPSPRDLDAKAPTGVQVLSDGRVVFTTNDVAASPDEHTTIVHVLGDETGGAEPDLFAIAPNGHTIARGFSDGSEINPAVRSHVAVGDMNAYPQRSVFSTTNRNGVASLAWSADGLRLYVLSHTMNALNTQDELTLDTVDVATAKTIHSVHVFTHGLTGDTGARLASDGTVIVTATELEQSKQRSFQKPPGMSDQDFSVQVALMGRPTEVTKILAVDPDTGAQRTLAHDLRGSTSLAIDAGGQYILYNVVDDHYDGTKVTRTAALHALALDGTDRVVSHAEYTDAAW